ncbi:UNVERIFIED_CONTAM: TIGR04141 family sporadically distributed protein, partial [Aeromonas hydrophila]
DLNSKEFRNSTVSAIFLTRAGNRLFALSFGHGRHLLNPGCYEDRFGLRVTLNSVDPDMLRAVDVTTLEANPFHGKRQATRA